MTTGLPGDGPEWQPTIDAVGQEPSSTKPNKRLTEQDLQDRNRWLERKRAADLGVAFGMVDDGEKDPCHGCPGGRQVWVTNSPN